MFNNLLRKIYTLKITSTFLKILGKPWKGNGAILVYHRVLPDNQIEEDLNIGLAVSCSQFEKQIQLLKKYYSSMKQPLNESREKMAFMPQGSQILYNPITKAAGFRIKNVFVMAGIPEIMIAMFKNIIKKIKHGTPDISKTILINASETIIARDLFKIQNEFKEVEIGSYPFYTKTKKGVDIVLRSKNKNKIKQAANKIRNIIKFL